MRCWRSAWLERVRPCNKMQMKGLERCGHTGMEASFLVAILVGLPQKMLAMHLPQGPTTPVWRGCSGTCPRTSTRTL